MAEAYYEPTPATDGATMNPVPGAVFQVFEIADTAFATPLSLRVGSGNPTTTVAASETLATLPGVYVTSPNFEHIWKSGSFEWRRDSIDGAKKAIEDAKLAASNSANSAAASEQSAKDAANLVDAPADTAVKTLIDDPATQTAAALSATTARRTALNVELKGATGDNVVENTAFAAAMSDAIAARIASPSPTFHPDPVGQTVIELGPGVYRITDIRGLMGAQDPGSKAQGLKFKGVGSSLTMVIFEPAAADTLIFNDYWLGLRFEGITFLCETDGSTFMQSHTTHAAQEYTFTDVYWRGRWKHVFDLQGDNNNSEFRFFGCGSSSIQSGGAFLHVGTTNTTDQFLNYWFYGHKHWSTTAPLVDMARGGHVHIFGLDASDWGGALTAPGYLFYLRGASHALGVCTFNANGVRVEAKNALAGLLYSEWPQGNVTFTAADFSSQTNVYTYGDIITIKYANVGGSIYTFRDSNLAGGVNVAFQTSDWAKSHNIRFDSCYFAQKLTPSEVVTYDTTNAGSNLTYPKVQFANCRGKDTDIYSAGGASTWDATMGTVRGETVMSTPKRELTVRGVYGLTVDGQVAKVNLPIGAIITGFRVLAPSGGTSEGDGGTWSLKTTETTPVTVGEITVAGALSGGFNQSASIAVPYYCSTREKATLTISTTNVTSTNSRGLAIIEGYW